MKKHSTVNAALKSAEKFLDHRPNLKPGDRVDLNQWGKNRYKHPSDNSVAVVSKIIDPVVIDEHGNFCDIEITVVFDKDNIRPFLVDSRFFNKISKPAGNILNLFKAK